MSQCLSHCVLAILLISPSASQDGKSLRRTPIVDVFEKTHRTVVNISSTQIVKARRNFSSFDLFFDDFDDMFGTREYETKSVGSGFVIHQSGYIITNAHVVDRTVDRKVTFDDERSYDAKIVAIDREHDLALLKIETASSLDVISLGRSDDLMIGETVIAIGNPLGYEHTLTTGVISAANRDIELVNEKTGKKVVYTDLIQTDASINPGNSGGPLLNVLGKLIGINTAIRGDAQNIGFAIKVDTLTELIPIMLETELTKRFSIGLKVDAERVTTQLARRGPASRAGLRIGDRIVTINGTALQSSIDFYIELLAHGPGDTLILDVEREGSARRLKILLQEPPRPDGGQIAWTKLGLRLIPITKQEARRLGVRTSTGLLVTEVDHGGPADRVGILADDILTVIGRYYVSDLDEVGILLKDVEPRDRVYVQIYRMQGNTLTRDGTRLVAR